VLFNSYQFIFIFLPITLFVFFAIGKMSHHRVAIAWLVGTSLFFYGWWNPSYLGLILASVFFNYGVGLGLGNMNAQAEKKAYSRKFVLTIGVTVNLSLLAYYKYTNFFIDNMNALFDTNFNFHTIILPLAISFFTFQQIAYLVDAYKGETREYNFLHYCLFVTFFPQLIAGPIVHHREMLPQFARKETYEFKASNFSVGITIFIVGLFKKVVLADGVALYSTPVFTATEEGSAISFFVAWCGALAYTLQLYFDFSGYSDMAVGIGRLFGIYLPANFFSPYKAVNIIQFWQRWHITLSSFLRSYLYIPLGGNRLGSFRKYMNLMITMFLGGLWHGANWTFVAWGTLHGIFLLVNHLWHSCRKHFHYDNNSPTLVGIALSRFVTFIAVVIAWVFFRAESYAGAKNILYGMAGINGFILPSTYQTYLDKMFGLGSYLTTIGWKFQNIELFFGYQEILYLLFLLVIIWLLPNTQQFMCRHHKYSEIYKVNPHVKFFAWLEWDYTHFWAIAVGILALISVLHLTRISEFLYFQF